jgi:hypothetical protein
METRSTKGTSWNLHDGSMTVADSAKIIPRSSFPGEVKVVAEVLVRMPWTECAEAHILVHNHRRSSQ